MTSCFSSPVSFSTFPPRLIDTEAGVKIDFSRFHPVFFFASTPAVAVAVAGALGAVVFVDYSKLPALYGFPEDARKFFFRLLLNRTRAE